MPGDEQTIHWYNEQAGAYAERGHGKGAHPRLASFVVALPPAASVLDLGCGGGQDALALRAHGLAATGADASAVIAAEARARTGLDIRVMEFAALADVAAFDGIWASASLHHIPAAELPLVFAAIHRALKPGGLLYASFKVGGVDRRDRFGRLYCEMSERRLRGLVADAAKWQAPEIVKAKGSGYDNEPIEWLMLTVRRALSDPSIRSG